MFINSDSREKLIVSVGGSGNRDWSADRIGGPIDVAATIQARSNLDITIAPSWGRGDDPMQYIDPIVDGSGTLHLTGHIDLTTLSLTIRANWTFSPHLSLQAYAQPYIAAGTYTQLKDVNNPHARTSTSSSCARRWC